MNVISKWIAGPFGHCYIENANGLLWACPQNSNGTPDDREDAICCVMDWENNEERNTALRWWAANASTTLNALRDLLELFEAINGEDDDDDPDNTFDGHPVIVRARAILSANKVGA